MFYAAVPEDSWRTLCYTYVQTTVYYIIANYYKSPCKWILILFIAIFKCLVWSSVLSQWISSIFVAVKHPRDPRVKEIWSKCYENSDRMYTIVYAFTIGRSQDSIKLMSWVIVLAAYKLYSSSGSIIVYYRTAVVTVHIILCS